MSGAGPDAGGYRPRPSPRPHDAPTEVIARRSGTVVADPPTEVIPSYTDPPLDPPPPEDDRLDELPPEGPGRKAVRTFGELLITAGMVVLLFVFYEIYVTDWLSAGKQHAATSELDDEWRKDHFSLIDGRAFAKLHIPAFGPDYVFSLVEGTTDQDLDIGPGHYKGTALPGQPGNFAVAGHRVGKGAPFNDLDLLQSCDAVVVETQTDWFVYRVLPMKKEVQSWQQGRASQPQCKGVSPLGGLYGDTVGQEIVLPSESDVIAPVPHHPGIIPSRGQEAALLTLTTCHPKFSAAQRLVVHAVLVKQYPKDPKNPGQVPPELKESQ
ncbi:class E sortase [Gandjariella thermophila]|uniref:Class E sortase n=1 Tax=Gandjariella thermophila TaxID=1931992 RepID=A0A4D4J718_9PSEU|nr:class E sortase [Gandjariella thermophila]GDY30952.1 class E sortase [Gandjariella thermophila]